MGKGKKRNAAAGGSGVDKNRKKRPGFSYTTSDKNSFPLPQLLSTKRIKIRLLTGQDPNADTLTFVIRSHPLELIRLLPQPIRIKYVASQPTPNKQAADPERSYLRSLQANEVKAYIDPFTASSTFFSRADVVLDNHCVSAQLPPHGGLLGFYTQAIKSFMTEEAKNRVYGDALTIPDEETRNNADSGEMKQALKSLEFDSKTAPTARTISLSMDSVPFLGPARNPQLASLQGREPPETFSYLPPQTSLMIRLFRQRPDYQNIEIVDGTNRSDTDYFKHADLTVEPPDIKFEIKDIHLMAETCRVTPAGMDKLMKAYAKTQLHFLMDVVYPSYQHLPSGVSEAHVTFMLEKGTKLVYFFFVTQHQLFLNKTSKKTCSFRVVVPPTLKQVRFFYGADELHFDQGLGKLHGTNVAGNLDVLTFETYLKQRNWLDNRYPHYFPRKNEFGYRSFFPLDLTAFDGNAGGRELSADLQFFDAGAAEGLICVALRVVEGDLCRIMQDGKPKWNLIPNIAEK